MSKNKIAARIDSQNVEVKTKFDAEFRRFSLNRSERLKYEEFRALIEKLHRLHDVTFLLSYTDPRDGDLLPINNDDNLARAILTAKPLLRVIIQRKGDSFEALNGYGTMRPKNIISSFLSGTPAKNKGLAISNPHDFRMVSAIIDVDIVPETCRRVKLLKHGSERPLGFFIRDGTSVRVTPNGVERTPGIFISRLVPGGLAESTGLLGVNDEVLEVNGIDVSNKTLDQVTDMMVANSSNLIITVRPANQRAVLGSTPPPPPPEVVSHHSQPSSGEPDEDRFDQDEIVDLTAVSLEDNHPESSGSFPHSIPSKDDGQILHL
ncbi:Partitioning defective protein 6 [Eumeta japonica]|uniref:Partitioning defective protein 6 n=1 Tax=Eumeta variegata TaxID=151549 RepID=A0A4C1U3L1_EUMVA|nr:Partitioning defective protein 6 [Eumeta japonica]